MKRSEYFEQDRHALYEFARKADVRLGPRVLNVGCAAGADSENIRRLGGEYLVGIEPFKEACDQAANRYNETHNTSFESYVPNQEFDAVIFADSLEHMPNPEAALRKARSLLNESEGYMLISLPNVRHISVLFDLLIKGDWRYRDSGILDSSHMRFFTSKSAVRLVEDSQFEIISFDRYGSVSLGRAISRVASSLGEFLLTQLFLLARPC